MTIARAPGPIVILFVAGAAAGQTCQPAWDVAPGNPGIGGGYAAAVRGWNDGTGALLYIGGSFTTAGGSSAGRYLARWDPASNTWSAVGGGISPGFTNAFMTSLVPFNLGTGGPYSGAFQLPGGGLPTLGQLRGEAGEVVGDWLSTIGRTAEV